MFVKGLPKNSDDLWFFPLPALSLIDAATTGDDVILWY